MLLAEAIFWVAPAVSDTSATDYGVYALISGVLVAFITVGGGIIMERVKSGGKRHLKAAHKTQALTRWILLNTHADPDLIHTGNETPQEVRRARPHPGP